MITKLANWRDQNPGKFAAIVAIYLILALGYAGEMDYQEQISIAGEQK